MLTAAQTIVPWLNKDGWARLLEDFSDKAAVEKFLREIPEGTEIRFEGTEIHKEWDSPLPPA